MRYLGRLERQIQIYIQNGGSLDIETSSIARYNIEFTRDKEFFKKQVITYCNVSGIYIIIQL